MLCLNCIHARDEIPEKVEVEVKVNEKVERIDITDILVEAWKGGERRGYTTIIFCERMKVVKVGSPPSPAKTVTECGEFAEA